MEKPATGMNMVQELSVMLFDIKQDGLVMYDSVCPRTAKLRKVGYCITCEKTLHSFPNIYDHLNEYPSHAKIFFKCDICQQNIVGRDTLRFHKESHSEKLECNICAKKFSNRTAFHRHFKQHSSDALKCPICFKTYCRKSNVTRHVLQVHTAKTCRKCGQTFKNKRELRTHMKCHFVEWKHKCNACGYSCNSKEIMNKHRTRHLTSCLNIFKRKPYFKQHNSSKRRNTCRQCSANFTTDRKLQLHIHREHFMKLACEVCQKEFSDKRGLEEHLGAHQLLTVMCTLCDNGYLDVEFSRKLHLIEEHGGAFQCRQCAKVFHSANMLRNHFKNIHPTKETFRCDHCGDIFVSKSGHERHHEWCNETAKDPESLHQNVPTAAPLTNDMNCAMCQKNFPNLQSLQNHLLSLDCQLIENEEADLNTLLIDEVKLVSEKPSSEEDKPDEKKKKKVPLEQVKCDKCNITFKNKLRLDKHIWHKHTDEFLSENGKEKKKLAEARKIERRNSSGRLSFDLKTLTDEHPDKSDKDCEDGPAIPPEHLVSKDKNGSRRKEKNFSCLECGKKYWKGSALEAHIARRHIQQETPNSSPVQNTNTEHYNFTAYNRSDKDGAQRSSYPIISSHLITQQPPTPTLPNQISITIGPMDQMQNVCIPLVINSYAPGINAAGSNACTGASSAAFMLNVGENKDNEKGALQNTGMNTPPMPINSNHGKNSSLIEIGKSSTQTAVNRSITAFPIRKSCHGTPVSQHIDNFANKIGQMLPGNQHTYLAPNKPLENFGNPVKQMDTGSAIQSIVDFCANSDFEREKTRRDDKESTEKTAAVITLSDDEELQVIGTEPSPEKTAEKSQLHVDCFICDKRFNRINKLLHHLRNNHN